MAGKKRAVIRMYNGRLVDVYDLQPEDIIPENFIHALSLINRYTGATRRPYSVAEHTVHMTDWFTLHTYLCGEERLLIQKIIHLHDWAEALFNDIASPVKRSFPTYRKHEKEASARIFSHYGIPWHLEEHIKFMDIRIRVDEKRALWDEAALQEYVNGSPIYEGCSPEPLGIAIPPFRTWQESRRLMGRYHHILFNQEVSFE